MTQRGEDPRARRFHTVRARLTLQYAGLFLAAGAVLLGLTYGLVANSIPVQHVNTLPNRQQQTKLNATCKAAAQQRGTQTPNAGKPIPQPAPDACRTAFTLGAAAAANDQRATTLHNLLLFSLLGLGIMTIASGAIGWVVAGRLLRPVRLITGAARRASEQHFGERLDLKGPDDELKQLADTFDDMLDRLDTAFSSQQRFVANASHELRTPLTVMRTAIDVTLSKPDPTREQLETMARKVRHSVDQADQLIDALLTLAVSEQKIDASEPVDLATLTEDALDAIQPEIDRLNLQVERTLEPAPTTGDAILLQRLAGNLVDNAVHHNKPGGSVRVETHTSPQGAVLRVWNDGPSVAPERVADLFEPFQRIDERTNPREGVGLGLAIVKTVCIAHGGTVDAQNRTGGGLDVTVQLPPVHKTLSNSSDHSLD